VSIQVAARSGLRSRLAWRWAALATLALSIGVVLRDWHSALGAEVSTDALARVVGLALPAALLLLATGLHYAASGVALQAAAGVRLPARERYLSQLAAAAANRMTPGGVGAAALNARYLTRRGSTATGALAAIGVLQILGAVADLSVLASLFVLGSALGFAPVDGFAGLRRQAELPVTFVAHQPWVFIVLPLVGVLVILRRRRAAKPSSAAAHPGRMSSLLSELKRLRERPRDVVTVMGASASTTIVLGVGFAASVAVVAGPGVWRGFLPLVVGYMLGSAVGNAAPVPSGIGTTDTALVGVVAASGVVMHEAVIAVLIFRLVTFWMPAGLGLIAGAALRRQGAY
jgi:uncharacterized membrane protein YbhN (UPF0104 family)